MIHRVISPVRAEGQKCKNWSIFYYTDIIKHFKVYTDMCIIITKIN